MSRGHQLLHIDKADRSDLPAIRTKRVDKFHKIVLFTLTFNEAGLRLYRKTGYREVGLFREQGMLDGRFVDVTAMEKIIATTGSLRVPSAKVEFMAN